MKVLKKFVLKLMSSPMIDMQASYKYIRKIQELVFPLPSEQFRYLDRKIYSVDQTHEIPIRIFQPKEKRSDELLLFFHGGGWVLGNIDTYTKDCIKMADRTGRTVLSVDYLKAPEYPFPAGFDDCYHVAEILINQPELTGIANAREVILIGNSAGGNLAAAVSLRLRDENKQLPRKQILINPVTYWNHDARSPFRSIEENGYDYGLTAKKMQEYMSMYEPDNALRKTSYVAPLMADDLSRQPNTLIITSEFDPLRDEGEVYGHLLRKAGNLVHIFRAKDTVHNYIFGPVTEQSVEVSYKLIEDFLDNRLRGSAKNGASQKNSA